MGASNVKAVFGMWPDLPNTAFRLLVHMAVTSKDADDPPRYWGGREDMAEALGRKVPPANDGDAEVTRQRNAAFKAVRECTTLLTKRGAIVPLKKAWTGQRQEWALNLRHGLHENRAPLPEAEVHENRAPVDGPEPEDDARLVHEKRAERCTENVQEAHENRADWCTETVPPRRREEERGEAGVSQSVQDRAGSRWLHREYEGLTDLVVARVIKHLRDDAKRRGRPIRKLVPYLEAMRDPNKGQDEADLADVIAAAMDAEEQLTRQPEPDQEAAPPRPGAAYNRTVAEATALPDEPPDEPTKPRPVPAEPESADQAVVDARAELRRIQLEMRAERSRDRYQPTSTPQARTA